MILRCVMALQQVVNTHDSNGASLRLFTLLVSTMSVNSTAKHYRTCMTLFGKTTRTSKQENSQGKHQQIQGTSHD